LPNITVKNNQSLPDHAETLGPKVALVTYSTKARGGVVHTLHLAEALQRLGKPLHLFALGNPETGFYRPTEVSHTIIPAPPTAPTLEERVFRIVDAIAVALAEAVPGRFEILHAQDCIGARAATRVRDLMASQHHIAVVRTVHHVDDFTTPALIECQNRSILDPDRLLVVSEHWRRLIREEYGRDADVVTNGVDAARFARPDGFAREAMRARIGANGRFFFLHVGGIEPRKGSLELIEALAEVRSRLAPPPVLAVIGSKPFRDYSGYRDMVFERAAELGLEVDRDLALLETVGDAELPSWYQAADAFVFPSVKEGWGLAVLEALAAGLPTVTSNIPVFHEYLRDEQEAIMVPAGNSAALADAMLRMATDGDLRHRLSQAGPRLAARFTWEGCARQHLRIYQREV
jgi:glycosyltransferase-like protein